jgi:long-chain acyl-CoA synthetase
VVGRELWVRTASAMLGYLNYPSPFDSEGWFNTMDVVDVDGDFVRILGRASEIINVGGQKVYPAEIEAVLTQADNVEAAAAFGHSNAIMGQIVVARVVLRVEERDAERRLIAFCRQWLSPHQVPMLIEITREPLHSERGKLIRRRAPNGG